jgi:hypothetical protein
VGLLHFYVVGDIDITAWVICRKGYLVVSSP